MRRKILGLLGIAIVLAAGFWGVAGAESFRSGNAVNVGAGETVNSTLWASGRTIHVAGTVRGDLFCAAQNVTVSGTIEGDVLCAAQTITISGTVNGNVRTAGQSVTITSAVSRNVSALAQAFSQESKSAVGGDIGIAGNDITLNGSIGRDVSISSGTAFLNGRVGRNVQANVNSLSLGSSAAVAGNLSYTSPNNVKLASGATIEGQTTKSSPKNKKSHGGVSIAGIGLGFVLYMLVAGLVVALVLVLIFPHALRAITAQGLASPWKALLVGLIAAVIVPPVTMLAFATVVGIPLGLILLGAWLLLGALAFVAASFYLGRLVWRSQHNAILVMLVGAVLLIILVNIPFIGWIFWIAAALLGTGMILLELSHRWPKPNYNLEASPANKRAT